MGSCRTAGVSLCPKPEFRYFDFTSPSENGVHGTAIDSWVATSPWPRFSDARIQVRNMRNPGFGHSETHNSPAQTHLSFVFLCDSVAPWCAFAFWLRTQKPWRWFTPRLFAYRFEISLLGRFGRHFGGGFLLAGGLSQHDQVREDRRYFHRHLVAGGAQGHGFALQHLDVVVPGIELHAAAERQGGNLGHVFDVDLRGLGDRGRADGVAFGQAGSEVRAYQPGQLGRTVAEHEEEESGD